MTKLDVGVDTTSSHCSSHTGRPNRFTQASDTKECVAPNHITHNISSQQSHNIP